MSKQFLKCVDDIKNKVINNKMKPINSALCDINPLRQFEYKPD